MAESGASAGARTHVEAGSFALRRGGAKPCGRAISPTGQYVAAIVPFTLKHFLNWSYGPFATFMQDKLLRDSAPKAKSQPCTSTVWVLLCPSYPGAIATRALGL